MGSDDHIRETAAIQEGESTIALPEELVRAAIVAPRHRAYWTVYQHDGSVAYLSMQRDLFEGGDGIRIVGSSVLSPDGTVDVPAHLVGADGLFDPGEQVQFVADAADQKSGICRVLPDDADLPASIPEYGWLEEDDMVILGRTAAREAANRMTIPTNVVAETTVSPGDQVKWVYGPSIEAHVVVVEDGAYPADRSNLVLGETMTLQANRTLTIPKRYFPDYTGPYAANLGPRSVGKRFEYGESVVFAVDAESASGDEPGYWLVLRVEHLAVA